MSSAVFRNARISHSARVRMSLLSELHLVRIKSDVYRA